MTLRPGVPLLLLLPCLALAGPQPAVADDGWKAAKKAFKRAQKVAAKDEDWKLRQEAYADLAYFDGDEAVKLVLATMAKERNPAVLLTAIETLGAFRSGEAQEALLAATRKKGLQRLYVLRVLARQQGESGKDVLLELLRGKDAQAAAQAALALGGRGIADAVPVLKETVLHKHWQVRAASARALLALKPEGILDTLIEALEMSAGSERRAIVAALEGLSGQAYGLDVAAWKKLAGGAPAAQIRARPIPVPHIFGIPIYGKRVVFLITNSQRNEDPHRFGSGKRLEELCVVPHARPILHTRLVTVGDFIHAHMKRCIQDLPAKTKFDVIPFNTSVNPLFSKLTPANPGTVQTAHAEIDGLTHGAGMNHYGAMVAGLDIAGSKDTAAWGKGPDEIIFTACNMPNQGEIKQAPVVAAAIGLKAGLRMVPIHAIGVETHAFEMMKTIAKETGGVYLDLHK